MILIKCALVKINKGILSTPLLITLVGCSAESESSPSTVGLAAVIMLLMFVASLAAGAIPLLGIRTHTNLLRWATSLAAGVLNLVSVIGCFTGRIFTSYLEIRVKLTFHMQMKAEHTE